MYRLVTINHDRDEDGICNQEYKEKQTIIKFIRHDETIDKNRVMIIISSKSPYEEHASEQLIEVTLNDLQKAVEITLR